MPTLFFRDYAEVHGGERQINRQWVFLTKDGYTVGTLLDHDGHRRQEWRYEWIINSDGRPMEAGMVGSAPTVARAKLDFAKAYRKWLEATGKDESWRPTQYPPLNAEARKRLRMNSGE